MHDHQPIARLAPAPPCGMVTLKGDPGRAGLRRAVKAAVGLSLPGRRAMLREGERVVAWMAPDEVMLFMPRGDVAAALAAARKAFGKGSGLVADVSDARVLFTVAGPHAREVLARLSPADMGALGPGEMRRTRLAQIPAGIWHWGEGAFTVMVFRSVAEHARALLENAAAGPEAGFFAPGT